MTYWEFAEQVNIDLGGNYVNGVLTPPSWWTGSITQWSRYVQEETAKRSVGMTFTSLPQSEIDALHYGGYPPGSVEAQNYVRQVEAQGWVWSYDKNMWERKDTGYIYIEPVIPTTIEPEPINQSIKTTTQPIIAEAGTFLLPVTLLFGLGFLMKKQTKRRIKSGTKSR